MPQLEAPRFARVSGPASFGGARDSEVAQRLSGDRPPPQLQPAKQFVIVRALEPGVIDFAWPVASAKNQINVIPAAADFGEPMRRCLLGFVSGSGQGIHGHIDMMRSNVQNRNLSIGAKPLHMPQPRMRHRLKTEHSHFAAPPLTYDESYRVHLSRSRLLLSLGSSP